MSGVAWDDGGVILPSVETLTPKGSERLPEGLNQSQFKRLLGVLGVPQIAGEALFAAFDYDGNGFLDFREVFIGFTLLLSDSPEERLRCGFMMMDADGSGELTLSEVTAFLETIAPPEDTNQVEAEPDDWREERVRSMASAVMKEADLDGKGFITLEEFSLWCEKSPVDI